MVVVFNSTLSGEKAEQVLLCCKFRWCRSKGKFYWLASFKTWLASVELKRKCLLFLIRSWSHSKGKFSWLSSCKTWLAGVELFVDFNSTLSGEITGQVLLCCKFRWSRSKGKFSWLSSCKTWLASVELKRKCLFIVFNSKLSGEKTGQVLLSCKFRWCCSKGKFYWLASFKTWLASVELKRKCLLFIIRSCPAKKPDRSYYVANSGDAVQKANSLDFQVVKSGLPALNWKENVCCF